VRLDPVTEGERRAAVLLVVGADRLEERGVAGGEPLLVGDDRAAALADRLLEADEAVVLSSPTCIACRTTA
jgi:hypothetical protein